MGGAAGAEAAREREVTARGLTDLFIVYLVWGGTYLAIRIAVRPESGLPPFTMGLMRMLVAGTLLIGWSALRGTFRRPDAREMGILVGSGLLIWTGANGIVIWAEQGVDSSFAALLAATIPLWTVALNSLFDRRLPTGRVLMALLVGFLGTALLVAPELRFGAVGERHYVQLLILAPVSWSLGTLLQQRHPVRMGARLSAGYQMLFAAVGFTTLVLLTGEVRPEPTAAALLAWLYLVVFGSILAFTAYVEMLQSLPVSLAMTYAYINPVIAVILGAWLLNEQVSWTTLLGAGLVLVSVAVIFREQAHRR
ncbi:MAG: EamA family transporter [Anaerolineales bacterium]